MSIVAPREILPCNVFGALVIEIRIMDVIGFLQGYLLNSCVFAALFHAGVGLDVEHGVQPVISVDL